MRTSFMYHGYLASVCTSVHRVTDHPCVSCYVLCLPRVAALVCVFVVSHSRAHASRAHLLVWRLIAAARPGPSRPVIRPMTGSQPSSSPPHASVRHVAARLVVIARLAVSHTCRQHGDSVAQPRSAGSSPRWSCVSENVLIRPRHAVVHGFRRDSPSSACR